GQILRSKKRPRRTLRSGRGSRTNSNTSRQIPARVIDAAHDRLPTSAPNGERRIVSQFEFRRVGRIDRTGVWWVSQGPSLAARTLAKFGLGIDGRPIARSECVTRAPR